METIRKLYVPVLYHVIGLVGRKILAGRVEVPMGLILQQGCTTLSTVDGGNLETLRIPEYCTS